MLASARVSLDADSTVPVAAIFHLTIDVPNLLPFSMVDRMVKGAGSPRAWRTAS